MMGSRHAVTHNAAAVVNLAAAAAAITGAQVPMLTAAAGLH